MPIKKHPLKWRKKAFRLWRQSDHNCLQVSKEMKKMGYSVSHVTIARWSEYEDWEAKEAVAQNELRRIMRQSDDPVLRELVMDDLEFAKFLRQLSGVLTTMLGTKRNRLLPKTLKEAIDVAKFIREQRELLLGTRPTGASPAPPNVNFTFNDNRRVALKQKIAQLSPEQRQFVLEQARTIDQNSDKLNNIRKQVMDAKAQ